MITCGCRTRRQRARGLLETPRAWVAPPRGWVKLPGHEVPKGSRCEGLVPARVGTGRREASWGSRNPHVALAPPSGTVPTAGVSRTQTWRAPPVGPHPARPLLCQSRVREEWPRPELLSRFLKHVCTHTCTHAPTHTSHAHTCTHVYAHTHTHVRIQTRTHTLIHTHVHTRMPPHTHACTYPHTHSAPHTTSTCMCVHTCITHPPTYMHTHVHTHITHMLTQAHMRTRMRTLLRQLQCLAAHLSPTAPRLSPDDSRRCGEEGPHLVGPGRG